MDNTRQKIKLTGQGGPGRGQGRKPSKNPRVPFNTRVHPKVLDAIRLKSNMAKYIEHLVCKDQNIEL